MDADIQMSFWTVFCLIQRICWTASEEFNKRRLLGRGKYADVRDLEFSPVYYSSTNIRVVFRGEKNLTLEAWGSQEKKHYT